MHLHKVTVVIKQNAGQQGRYLEINHNLGRKKRQRTNEDFNFPGSSFGNRDNVTVPTQHTRKRQSKYLKR